MKGLPCIYTRSQHTQLDKRQVREGEGGEGGGGSGREGSELLCALTW